MVRRLTPLAFALLVALLGLASCTAAVTSTVPPTGMAAVRPTATAGPIQSLLAIQTDAGERCPTGVAWSPDALTIAVAADGEQDRCDAADPGRTQVVTLYDARSGVQLKRLVLYSILAQAKIGSNRAYAGQPSWSPDGSILVVPFDLLDETGQHSALLVMPVGSGTPRVLIDSVDTSLVHPLWNLRTRQLVATQTKALPQALTYRWSANGSIQPAEPVPPPGATAYTGSPVEQTGGATFSRWRRGFIGPVLREGYIGDPFAWFHSDAGALWSPDGQYVAPDYSIATRLPEPVGAAPADLLPQDSTCAEFASAGVAETTAASLATTYCGQSTLPYPDAAYAAAVAQARAGVKETDGSGNSITGWTAVEVAWRPDGKVLAAMLPVDDFAASPGTVRVTLYDTATGKVLTKLSRTVSQPSSQTNAPRYLSWSPTGQQLALVNNGDSQVIVWGASSLASLPPIVP